jgi:predicted Mrr-cat superfamily restriction endonuclease
MEEFLKDDLIAVGWPHLPALNEITQDQLLGKLQAGSPNLSRRTLKMQQNMIVRFSSQMKTGDLVIVPYGKSIYFARIKSDYFFSRAHIKDGYPHQRKVEWLLNKKGYPRLSLDTTLRGALRPQLALYSLEDYGPSLEKLLVSLESDQSDPHVELKERSAAVINKELVSTARQALLETLRSDDPAVRLRAVQIILEHYQDPLGHKLKTGS